MRQEHILEATRQELNRHASYLTTSPAGTADSLSNHIIDFKLSNIKHTQKSEQADVFHYKCEILPKLT